MTNQLAETVTLENTNVKEILKNESSANVFKEDDSIWFNYVLFICLILTNIYRENMLFCLKLVSKATGKCKRI